MTTLDFNHKAIKNIPRYTCGIYSIHNKLTNDRYIGSSTDIRSRVTAHLISVTGNNNSRANKNLLSDVRKYGVDKFEIEILETCEDNKSTISFLECKYIRELGTYNCVRVDGRIVQFDKAGNFIRTFNKIYEAAKLLNADLATIHRCCKDNKNSFNRTAYGYKWKFYEDYLKECANGN